MNEKDFNSTEAFAEYICSTIKLQQQLEDVLYRDLWDNGVVINHHHVLSEMLPALVKSFITEYRPFRYSALKCQDCHKENQNEQKRMD